MGVTISTMADTHFPARDRLNHSAALPPQYRYVPPTPNNFAPKGTIYDGYEAFKAQNTPALYRFSTTFQDRAAPEYPHSVEAHEDAIRKLQNDFSAVTGKSQRAGHDLIQPGVTSFVERPVNPYFKRCVDDSWANGPGPNVPGPNADTKP